MELWNKCSEKLENTLSQEDYNTWIRPLKAKIDKNTLELVAPNDFILDYIEKNYSKEIKKIVKSQSKSNINLIFKTLTKETFIDKYKNNQIAIYHHERVIQLVEPRQLNLISAKNNSCFLMG